MPPSIDTLHTALTLIAYGILIGAGWALILMALKWPADRIAGAAAIVCLAVLVLAWLVP